jgi:hypothetical protein
MSAEDGFASKLVAALNGSESTNLLFRYMEPEQFEETVRNSVWCGPPEKPLRLRRATYLDKTQVNASEIVLLYRQIDANDFPRCFEVAVTPLPLGMIAMLKKTALQAQIEPARLIQNFQTLTWSMLEERMKSRDAVHPEVRAQHVDVGTSLSSSQIHGQLVDINDSGNIRLSASRFNKKRLQSRSQVTSLA